MGNRVSLRNSIDLMCKQCIYDPIGGKKKIIGEGMVKKVFTMDSDIEGLLVGNGRAYIDVKEGAHDICLRIEEIYEILDKIYEEERMKRKHHESDY